MRFKEIVYFWLVVCTSSLKQHSLVNIYWIGAWLLEALGNHSNFVHLLRLSLCRDLLVSLRFAGVLYELLSVLNETLPLTIQLGRRYNINDFQEFKNATLTAPPGGRGLIVLPVTRGKKDYPDPCIVSAYNAQGSAYIVKRNVKKPLLQLGNSFINGGQIMAIILILSIISGIFIWMLVRWSLFFCLHIYCIWNITWRRCFSNDWIPCAMSYKMSSQDRRSNGDCFPASFITGTWQGFWWAFVTMTTVG